MDLSNLSKEELRGIAKESNAGAKEFNNVLETIRNIQKEIYGKDIITSETVKYLESILNGEKTIDDYRNYLQHKKTLDDMRIGALNLPEYVKVAVNGSEEDWRLDFIETNDRDELIIKYVLEKI